MASKKEKKAMAAEEKIAAQLGITREELLDRNVPDLGFDGNGERRFDYGARSFIVTITPNMDFAVFEAKSGQDGETRGKKTKNLPKPGKKDDADIAAAAMEEFKQLKKDLKAEVKKQKKRMELVLMTARKWSVDAWKELFEESPIMHPLAIGMVWGIYEEGKLAQSFRYREDGSFCKEDGEEFKLPQTGKITLVHPLELTKEQKKAWEDQLWEDEVEPPIDQLDRQTYTVHKREAEKKKLVRFQKKMLHDWLFGRELEKMGWEYCMEDENYYDIYYREDKDAGLCVELHTSGNTLFECDMVEITLRGARFYKAGTFDWENHTYDEADEEKAIALQDIPARYFSEVILQMTEAACGAYLGDE